MRIAIDISPLQSDHKFRGTGLYTQQLIEALQRYERKHSYYFFTRGQKIPENVDLVHYPYFDPFFLTLPLIKSKPTVVTAHDLIPIAHAKHFPRGLRGELKWQIQKISLVGAHTILTDSYTSERDIVRLTGISKKKIHVVYLAPSTMFTKAPGNKSYALPAQYVLYVGDVNWNKNIPGLLHAFAEVRQKKNNIDLVLVGKQFLNNSLSEVAAINTLIRQLHLELAIHRLGFVKEQDLASVYSQATLYIQPSFAEGFGLPVLEAMVCECPVVCTNVSSLVEIAGPSITVNLNPHAMAMGITKVLSMTKSERAALVKSGIAWSKRFTWEKVAKETVVVYEKALE